MAIKRVVCRAAGAGSGGDDDCGGYEHDFVGSVPHKYMCVICDKVLRDARLTACCGQHFCDSCLARWTSVGSRGRRTMTCPHCRSENFHSILNKERIREINELRVRCAHQEKGCGWEGELGSVKRHLEFCGYVLVGCDEFGFTIKAESPSYVIDPETHCYFGPNMHFWGWDVNDLPSFVFRPSRKKQVGVMKMCEAVVERRCLKDHKEKECPYRQYKCEHCGYYDTYDAIAGDGQVKNKDSKVEGGGNHYGECSHFPLDCPNKCGAKNIKRKNMEAHHDKCPQEPIDCPFGAACLGKVTRTNVESHKEECDFRPYTCEFCGTKGTFSSITGEESFKFHQLFEVPHYDECEQYPVDCPNSCGERAIKRKDVEAHRSKCPLEPADCPFSHVSCGVRVPQGEMEGHCREEMQGHLLMVARSHLQLSEKNKELVQVNEELSQSNNQLSRKCEELEREIARTRVKIDGLNRTFRQDYNDLDQRINGLAQSSSRGGSGRFRGNRGNSRRRGQRPVY